MKKLIILEDERRVQPFMLAEIEIAKSYFDDIIIVTKELTSTLSTTTLDKNITHIQITNRVRFYSFICTLLQWLSPTVLSIFYQALLSHRLNFRLINHILLNLVDSNALYRKTKNIINENPEDNFILLACWFSCEALAVAKLKNCFPQIKAISLAHSFEINPHRNPFVDISFNECKHKHLDMVCFISYNMRDIYNAATNNEYISYPSSVKYLGSLKKEQGLNPYNASNSVFKICTCSSVVPVKNLHLLVETLKIWDDGAIEWVHIGDGPDFSKLRKEVDEIKNCNVSVVLKGNVQNSNVHKYLVANQVDLFLNVSKSEGVPVSLMEAISYGIPILATDVGGSAEIIDTAYGVLIHSNPTPEELLLAIRNFIIKYKQNALFMRNAAYQFWMNNFNANKNQNVFFRDIIALN